MAILAARLDESVGEGDALGRIQIGKIGIDYVFVQGTDGASLRKGPGHYPTTALPGQGRTVAIAGHRTTYGAPFRQSVLRPLLDLFGVALVEVLIHQCIVRHVPSPGWC